MEQVSDGCMRAFLQSCDGRLVIKTSGGGLCSSFQRDEALAGHTWVWLYFFNGYSSNQEQSSSSKSSGGLIKHEML